MPRIDVTSEFSAIGSGAVDELAEWWDRRKGWMQPFRNATDWSRLGLGLVAGVAYMNNRYPRIAEPVLYAESALATKSVSRLIRSGVGVGSGGGAAARRRAAERMALTAGAGASIDVPNVGNRSTIKVTRI